MWQCSQWHDNKEEAKFCGKCGEKRVVQAFCTECGALLEPENVFCISCGNRRDTPVQIPAAPVLPPPAPVVVEKPAPPPPPPAPVAAQAPPVAVAAPAAPVPEPAHTTHTTIPDLAPGATFTPRSEDEPVTFSFGGALVEMKDDSKPEKAAQASGGQKMSSAQQAILSFVLFAAVLGAALYFVSR